MEEIAEKDFRRILFPTDFTDVSEEALGAALSLARRYGARLYVVHVVNIKDEAAGFYVPHLSFEKLDKDMEAGASMMLKDFCLKNIKGFRDYEMHVLKGEPFEEIIAFAEDNKIDMIVMGTYGKTGIDKFFFGSTTERVIRKADCPVLIVPPEGRGQ